MQFVVDADLTRCNAPCSVSQFLYQNSSCSTQCLFPYVQDLRDSNLKTCNSPCSYGQFLYQNNSCLLQCSSPYIQIVVDANLTICNPPCPFGQFLYKNNSCLPHCSFPYIPIVEGNNLTACFPVCSATQFLYRNDSCLNQCPQPYVLAEIDANLTECDLPCPIGHFLYQNNSCLTQCLSPHVQFTVDVNLTKCISPCTPNEYLYQNSSCLAQCSQPFKSISVDINLTLCNAPCSPSQYLYQNDSCLAHCPQPYIQSKSISNTTNCFPPCLAGQLYYQNNSCLNQCLSPYVKAIIDANLTECNYPCTAGKFLYQNDSCLSQCPSPYNISILDANLMRCNSPCNSSEFYDINTGGCVENCDAPALVIPSGVLQYCQRAETNQEVSPVAKTFQKIASVSNYVGGVFRPNNPNSVFMISLTKILKYVKFINVPIPTQYRTALDSSKSSVFSISTAFSYGMPSILSDMMPNYELPYMFQSTNSASSYLINFWQSMPTLSILIPFGILVCFIEFLARKTNYKKLVVIIERIRVIARWNFFLILLFNCFDDMTLFLTFELRNLHLSFLFPAISFLVCMAITAIGLYCLFVTFLISYQLTREEVKTSESNPHYNQERLKINKRWESYQVLYSGFKDSSFVKQACLLFQTLRIIVYYIIVAYLYDHAIIQSFLLMGIGILMLIYIIREKPFKDNFNLYVTLLFEIVVLIVNIFLVLLGLLDLTGHLTSGQANTFGAGILICNTILDTIGNILTWGYVVLGVWSTYKSTKMTHFRGKAVWLNILVVPYEGVGVGFDDDNYMENPQEQENEEGDLVEHDVNKQRAQNQGYNNTNSMTSLNFIYTGNDVEQRRGENHRRDTNASGTNDKLNQNISEYNKNFKIKNFKEAVIVSKLLDYPSQNNSPSFADRLVYPKNDSGAFDSQPSSSSRLINMQKKQLIPQDLSPERPSKSHFSKQVHPQILYKDSPDNIQINGQNSSTIEIPGSPNLSTSKNESPVSCRTINDSGKRVPKILIDVVKKSRWNSNMIDDSMRKAEIEDENDQGLSGYKLALPSFDDRPTSSHRNNLNIVVKTPRSMNLSLNFDDNNESYWNDNLDKSASKIEFPDGGFSTPTNNRRINLDQNNRSPRIPDSPGNLLFPGQLASPGHRRLVKSRDFDKTSTSQLS